MDTVIIALLFGLWVLILGAAAVVPLLPTARPGHEGALSIPVARHNEPAEETRAA
jgi:hypothetical protein